MVPENCREMQNWEGIGLFFGEETSEEVRNQSHLKIIERKYADFLLLPFCGVWGGGLRWVEETMAVKSNETVKRMP